MVRQNDRASRIKNYFANNHSAIGLRLQGYGECGAALFLTD
jgi:hypothetical protein